MTPLTANRELMVCRDTAMTQKIVSRKGYQQGLGPKEKKSYV